MALAASFAIVLPVLGPAAVRVPGLVVVLLVLATAVGVWGVMTWWRIRASRLRLLRRRDELAHEVAELRRDRDAAAAARDEAVEVLALQKDKTDVLRLRSRTLEKILAVSARMNATRNMNELMEHIVGAVEEIIGFRRVVLYVWSDVAQAFEARACAGNAPDGARGPGADHVTAAGYAELSDVKDRYSNCYLVPAGGAAGGHDAGADEMPPLVGREWRDGHALVAPLVTAGGDTIAFLRLEDPLGGLIPGVVEVRQLEFLVQQATTAIESAEVYEKLARNNAELSVASEKLNSLADLKKNFIANVSHELRTPLTSISAYTELLQNNMDSLSGDSQDEFLKVIHAESVKLTGIINDILELNQMDSGRPTLVHEDTNVAALVRRLDDSWRTRALERDIDLTVEVSSDEIVMPVDAMLIQQLLTHLVGNAFKFTPGDLCVGQSNFSGVFSALDRKSTRLNSSHIALSRMPSSA